MSHGLTRPELFKVKDLNVWIGSFLSLHTCHCCERSWTRLRGGGRGGRGHVGGRRGRANDGPSTEKRFNSERNQLYSFSNPCFTRYFNTELPSRSLRRIKQTGSIFKCHLLVCCFSSASAAALSRPSPSLVFSSPLTFLRKWC